MLLWFIWVDRREANNVLQYCLAKEASSKVIDSVWLENIPNFSMHVVLRERSCP
jgi:broad-specificity NMP kinase